MALRGSAMRKGDWKLIQTPHHRTMLFNLADDISGQNNLADQLPDKVDELTALNAKTTSSKLVRLTNIPL